MTATPRAIIMARIAAGLTQTGAAKLVGVTMRSWQNWEAGKHVMPQGLWELFAIKTDGAAPVIPDENTQ